MVLLGEARDENRDRAMNSLAKNNKSKKPPVELSGRDASKVIAISGSLARCWTFHPGRQLIRFFFFFLNCQKKRKKKRMIRLSKNWKAKNWMNVGKCSFPLCCIKFSISLISCSPYFRFIRTHNVLHARLAVFVNKNDFKAQRLALYQWEAKLSQKCGKKTQKDNLFMNFHTPFSDDFSLFLCLWIKLFAAGFWEKFFFFF